MPRRRAEQYSTTPRQLALARRVVERAAAPMPAAPRLAREGWLNVKPVDGEAERMYVKTMGYRTEYFADASAARAGSPRGRFDARNVVAIRKSADPDAPSDAVELTLAQPTPPGEGPVPVLSISFREDGARFNGVERDAWLTLWISGVAAHCVSPSLKKYSDKSFSKALAKTFGSQPGAQPAAKKGGTSLVGRVLSFGRKPSFGRKTTKKQPERARVSPPAAPTPRHDVASHLSPLTRACITLPHRGT